MKPKRAAAARPTRTCVRAIPKTYGKADGRADVIHPSQPRAFMAPLNVREAANADGRSRACRALARAAPGR